MLRVTWGKSHPLSVPRCPHPRSEPEEFTFLQSRVLNPERLSGKLTLVQTEEDALGIVQLSSRGDGALRIRPVEELTLGSEGWQLCGVDLGGLLEDDQVGVLGRYVKAQGAVPGPESPLSHAGGQELI